MNNYMIRFLDKVHMDNNKILITYIYALFVIPLFFGTFILFEATVSKQSLTTILAKTPLIAIDVIMTFTDFILGYYIWLKKNNVLKDLSTYHFFMLCQVIGQIMVGNLFCAILAAAGVLRTRQARRNFKNGNKIIRGASIAYLMIFFFCLILTVWLRSQR